MTTVPSERATLAPRVLPELQWLALERHHVEQVDAWTSGHRKRAGVGVAHPVEDFLFSYYAHKPRQLRRWHPGVGVALAGPAGDERLGWRWYGRISAADERGRTVGAVSLDVGAFLDARRVTVEFVQRLLTATAARPAYLGCFGLHEWAMAYGLSAEQQRHTAWPLRLGSAGTDAVVDAHRIRCSHADAFRFFTPAAQPLNRLQPQRSTQVELEQPGCLHATMDLYKWAFKLGPAVPGELLVDCFALARDVRIMDMRASPYDLSDLGYEPVRIEEADGKAAYVEAQRAFADRAAPVRARLLQVCEDLLGPSTGR